MKSRQKRDFLSGREEQEEDGKEENKKEEAEEGEDRKEEEEEKERGRTHWMWVNSLRFQTGKSKKTNKDKTDPQHVWTDFCLANGLKLTFVENRADDQRNYNTWR